MQGKNVLHQLRQQTAAQMMSYIIETASGKIIVIDGGWAADADNLMETLQSIAGRPRYDAWLLTHAHSDHFEGFYTIHTKYRTEIEGGKIYFNFVSSAFEKKYNGGIDASAARMEALLPTLRGRAVRIREGDAFLVGEARFDVLHSPRPERHNDPLNNSSVVYRMRLGGKTVLFPGDLGIDESIRAAIKYGPGLKSDYVEMAHHGQNGAGEAFYRAVSPDVCLWDTPLWLWRNDSGQGYNTNNWDTINMYRLMDRLGVQRHYVMKDGPHDILL